MEEAAASIVMRGLERYLIQVTAMVAIVMGALLLKWGSGEGAHLIVKGKRSHVQLLNASPGILFCLFGCIIAVYALLSPLSVGKDAGRQRILWSGSNEAERSFVLRCADIQIDTSLPDHERMAALESRLMGIREEAKLLAGQQ